LSDDLILTPTGRLRLREGETGTSGAWMRRVAEAFSSGHAAGLFALAAARPDTSLSSSLTYWRDLASRYLTHLCRTPESAGHALDPIDPPTPDETKALQDAAPPCWVESI
jgi:hypothetical protein